MDLPIGIQGSTSMNGMVTPAADYVCRAVNFVQLRNLALPVLIEEWVIEMCSATIFNKILSPVVQVGVTGKLLER